MKTFTENEPVSVDLGHKVLSGVVVSDKGGKYVIVKHDNFKGEVFNREKVKHVELPF